MENLWQIGQKINIEASRVRLCEPMRLHTTFRIGGPADLFVEVRSAEELSRCLAVLDREGLPWFILGGGANILVGDKGIRGAVLHLGGMDSLRPAEGGIWAESGTSVDRLCMEFLARGLGGVENFYGMPGSLGGAVYMNARCYDQDISSSILGLVALSPRGEVRELAVDPKDGALWSYKRSPFQPSGPYAGWTVLSALMAGIPSDASRVASIMRSRRQDRISKGHYDFPSAGSMFKNDRSFGMPSGVLIDRLGLKGCGIGDAGVSVRHGNIFVNLGQATATDMRSLISLVQEKVLKAYGRSLEPEVLQIGEF